MVYTYQPTMEEQIESRNGTSKGGIPLTDLFNKSDIQNSYMKGKRQLNMGDIIDRPIRIVSYEIYEGENNYGKKGEFIRFTYYLDDDNENIHETTSQSVGIKDRLRAIPQETIDEYGGILTVIEERKTPQGKAYNFAGL